MAWSDAARAAAAEARRLRKAGRPWRSSAINATVYHGTHAKFTEFRAPAMFSTSRDYASKVGPRVVAARLRIRNPADLRAMHLSPSAPNFAEIARRLRAQGYDGAHYRGEAWVAFDSAQVRIKKGKA